MGKQGDWASHPSYGRAVAIAGAATALLAGALALWLSAAAPSGAVSADQQQGTAVTVAQKTISWGSAASCVQNMGTADFGSLLPGATGQSAAFNGCVTSNSAGWGVSVSATDLVGPEVGGVATAIPKGNLRIRTHTASGGATGAALACAVDGIPPEGCSLGTALTLFSGTAAGTGGFAYDYELAVPASAAGGAYSGTVTFTASN
jgi:hypothetical protein